MITFLGFISWNIKLYHLIDLHHFWRVSKQYPKDCRNWLWFHLPELLISIPKSINMSRLYVKFMWLKHLAIYLHGYSSCTKKKKLDIFHEVSVFCHFQKLRKLKKAIYSKKFWKNGLKISLQTSHPKIILFYVILIVDNDTDWIRSPSWSKISEIINNHYS